MPALQAFRFLQLAGLHISSDHHLVRGFEGQEVKEVQYLTYIRRTQITQSSDLTTALPVIAVSSVKLELKLPTITRQPLQFTSITQTPASPVPRFA